MIVITDGPDNNFVSNSYELRGRGVTIVAVAIGNGPDRGQLDEMVMNPGLVIETDIEKLPYSRHLAGQVYKQSVLLGIILSCLVHRKVAYDRKPVHFNMRCMV